MTTGTAPITEATLMATDEVARAMKDDKLKVETVRVLSEITP